MSNVDHPENPSDKVGWGHCQHCRHFGEHGAGDLSEDLAERRCHQPELLAYELFVTGSGGCNHFQKAAGESMSLEEPTDAPSLH